MALKKNLKLKIVNMNIDRSRNKNGQYRQKRWDTHIWTIEDQYWIDLWVRSDMHRNTYRQKNDIDSIWDALKK